MGDMQALNVPPPPLPPQPADTDEMPSMDETVVAGGGNGAHGRRPDRDPENSNDSENPLNNTLMESSATPILPSSTPVKILPEREGRGKGVVRYQAGKLGFFLLLNIFSKKVLLF